MLPLVTILTTVWAVWALPSIGQAPQFKVLVFSKTAGFCHASIRDGIELIQQLGADHNFAVDVLEPDPTEPCTRESSDQAAAFTDQRLAQYAVVIFISTTGQVLNASQQAAFERYIGNGGGWVGIHAASDVGTDTNYWPWYRGLVGAYFKDHPPGTQRATILVEDHTHPSTRHLGPTWSRTDEWYNFQSNPRSQVNVLMSLDESSYSGGTMGDHPIAWYHQYSGGRSWYTALGHTAASFDESDFQQHLLGGIQWAAADDPTPTAAPPTPTATSQPLMRRAFLPFTPR
jgi:type 1 glutamine amidotransferase